jgi:tetratricopeptide (TPR) repeat protein
MLKIKAITRYKNKKHNISFIFSVFLAVLSAVIFLSDTSFPAELYDLALDKYKKGKYTEAVNLLANKTPKDAGDYNLLGWALLKSGNKNQAIYQFNQSLSLNPNSFDSYCGLGYSYFQSGNFGKALKSFEKGTTNAGDTDCFLGKGLALEKLGRKEEALAVFRDILSVDEDNIHVQERIKLLSPRKKEIAKKNSTEFYARGQYFWSQKAHGDPELFYVKGVNLSVALPGRFPSEFPEDEETYYKWLEKIGEMNANLIRIYTILPPQFYKSFAEYNKSKGNEEKIFLIHGIWAELPEKKNFNDQKYLKEIKQEIRNVIDVVHGNADIPHRYGHAHGIYRTDISDHVLGYIFGREWEPPEVVAYNALSPDSQYTGKYLMIDQGNPMEVWLTEKLDFLIEYESVTYRAQRPVTFMNWPPLDPLYHLSEATFREEVEFRRKTGEILPNNYDYTEVFDEDVVSLDETKIKATEAYRAGIFASYHVYPYYPDFLRHEERYSAESPIKGMNYYYNYLSELKDHYRNVPLLISEYGVPTSRGKARVHREGLHHGGINETEQADYTKKMTFAIQKAGCAGGMIFSWFDEWFKSNWMAKGMEKRGQLWFNPEDPEESYGLIAADFVGKKKLQGDLSAWEDATLLYSKDSAHPLQALNDGFDNARTINRVYADFDAGYLYLKLDVGGEINWKEAAYLIAIDTIGGVEGDHMLPFNLNIKSPFGIEFVILLHADESRILIDDTYNRTYFDKGLLRFPGLSGYKRKNTFKTIYNNDGIFTEIIIPHKRRFSRDGKVYPETTYNASHLRQGNLGVDSLADFFYSPANNFIEVRIPWSLLYFSDPSRHEVFYAEGEPRITDGLRIMAVSYKPQTIKDSTAVAMKSTSNAADILPPNMENMKFYTWRMWEFPEYNTRPKKSFFEMKNFFKKMTVPDLKISIPQGFHFTPVITEHTSLKEFLSQYETDTSFETSDLYGFALANLVRGLATKEPFYVLEAKYLLSTFLNISADSRRKKLAELGLQYIESILSGKKIAEQDTGDVPAAVLIKKRTIPTENFQQIIIGKSAIQVKKYSTIKAQVDRVTRDWLMAYNFNSSPWNILEEKIVPWHEGSRIKEIVNFTGSKIFPVWGTRARKIKDKWYAPDAEGVFRFILSEDKVYNYPTNFIINDHEVIINDTHGISALAWDATGADLAIGCGDYRGKAEAAYYLAQRGVNVYMPADRFLYMLIGVETDGVIIGSAPVKQTEYGAVIGDQPVSIAVNEAIVVSNSKGRYPLQYYDAPYRYFKALGQYLGKKLNIVPVEIKEYGKASSVVKEARKLGAQVIGIRVWGKEEHDSVASWLKEDKDHRAILFHSAIYPEGYRLFFEFSQQTSFGDINIDVQ